MQKGKRTVVFAGAAKVRTLGTVVLVLPLVLSACAGNPLQPKKEYLQFPSALNKGSATKPSGRSAPDATETYALDDDDLFGSSDVAAEEVRRTRRFDMSAESGASTGVVRTPVSVPVFKSPGEKVSFSSEKMPLVAFVNEVYGNILGLSFEIDPALEKRKDGVTLRIADQVTKQELFRLAGGVLDRFGVGMVQEGSIWRFVVATGKGGVGGNPPLLVSGRALPDMPEGHRAVFQVVPLSVINQNDAVGWLKRAYGKLDLEVQGDLRRNAVVLSGSQRVVQQALNALDLLDQPSFRGKYSARFELAFQSTADVLRSAVSVLKAQGYAVSTGGAEIVNASVVLLPLEFVNSVLVFAPNEKVLNHVARVIQQMDTRAPAEPDRSRVFYYEVKNTRADTLVKVLNGLFFGKSNAATPAAEPAPVNAAAGAAKPAGTDKQPTSLGRSVSQVRGRITLDESRNAIVFQGEPKDWQSIRQVLKRMDKPARQVLVEVTVAEITLTNQDAFGVEWLATTGAGNLSGTIGTLGGLSLGGTGLLYTLDNAGQTRFLLNAMAQNQKVSILSTPKVLVKSGEEASIDVGSEVPIVTSQTKDADIGADVVQEVQYRKTGVLLNVTPVVHSGNRVDLKLNQEVSEAQTNTTSNISSPSIFTRRVNTSVTLKDGGSVVLAGLITRSTNTGETGIPVLKDVPILGEAFKTRSNVAERKEMLILIRPYIIDNDEQAYSLTRSQQSQMQMFKLPVMGR